MEDNWETCKENVLPLKSGRNVAQLNQLLGQRKENPALDERKRKRE